MGHPWLSRSERAEPSVVHSNTWRAHRKLIENQGVLRNIVPKLAAERAAAHVVDCPPTNNAVFTCKNLGGVERNARGRVSLLSLLLRFVKRDAINQARLFCTGGGDQS